MRVRILVAENDPFFLDSVVFFLNGEGYDVTTAQSPEEALQLLADEDFDLVLTDKRLINDRSSWDSSGLAVYRAAVERGIPAILCTGSIGKLPADIVVLQKVRFSKEIEGKIEELLSG